MRAQREESVGEGFDQLAVREPRAPRLRDPLLAVVRARELSVDCAGRVRVVAEVDREQRAVAERVGAMERPQGGLE